MIFECDWVYRNKKLGNGIKNDENMIFHYKEVKKLLNRIETIIDENVKKGYKRETLETMMGITCKKVLIQKKGDKRRKNHYYLCIANRNATGKGYDETFDQYPPGHRFQANKPKHLISFACPPLLDTKGNGNIKKLTEEFIYDKL